MLTLPFELSYLSLELLDPALKCTINLSSQGWGHWSQTRALRRLTLSLLRNSWLAHVSTIRIVLDEVD